MADATFQRSMDEETMTEIQARAAVILAAERAAEGMLDRTQNRLDGLTTVTREEVRELARQVIALSAIASKSIQPTEQLSQ